MKKGFWVLSALAVVVLTACSAKFASSSKRAGTNPLILRAHFIGTEELFASPESAKLKEAWSLKSSEALKGELLTRAALLPSYWLREALPAGSPSQTNLFRPLLEDVLKNESYIECTATPDLLLAVKVSDARAQVWQTNLRQALTNWKLGQPSDLNSNGAKGFELKHVGVPGSIRVLRAGEWLLLLAGKPARETEVLANIKSGGRPAKPTGAFLDGSANLARFDGWLPILENFQNLPVAHFSLSNRADMVRTHAVFDFPKPHGWKPEPWLIPSNQIHDPLVSFLVIRGIAPVLEAIKPLAALGYKPTPNQITGWGYHSLPFQLNYAAPSRDVVQQLRPMTPRVSELVMGPRGTNFVGNVGWDTNGQNIVFRGLPLSVPHLGALKDSGNEFLKLAAFPTAPGTNRPPPGLYDALKGRNDLVAFDYEITSSRIPHWRQFYQLGEIATRRPFTSTNTPVQRWLVDYQRWLETNGKVNETVSELRSTSPTQMVFIRKSANGFAAFDAVTLGRWLESATFPEFGTFSLNERPPGRRPANRPR